MPITASDRDQAAARINALNRRIDDGLTAQRERDAYVRKLHTQGWTQVELAELIGISQQRISRIIAKENP